MLFLVFEKKKQFFFKRCFFFFVEKKMFFFKVWFFFSVFFFKKILNASHALQPLDVSVFGPQKKLWDKSLREFCVKHRVAMTKQHFFTVFDSAWRQTVRNPSNAISGFRSTGLVPFNVENIDFSRLITSSTVAKSRNDNSNVRVYDGEKVGLMRALAFLENQLDKPTIELFGKRMEEGYNLNLDNEAGIIGRTYKFLKEELAKASEEEKPSSVPICNRQRDDSLPVNGETDEEQLNSSVMSETNEPRPGPSGIPRVSSVMSETNEPCPGPSGIAQVKLAVFRKEQPLVMVQDELTDSHSSEHLSIPPRHCSSIQSDVDSRDDHRSRSPNNDPAEVSFDKFKDSPFKRFLKISDKVIVSRKKVTRNKIPCAFTAAEYNKSMRLAQEKKLKDQEEKEKRKEERERKKLLKKEAAKAKSKPVVVNGDSSLEESEGEITEVVYADSSG